MNIIKYSGQWIWMATCMLIRVYACPKCLKLKGVVHGTEVQSENGNILTSIRLCRIATKTMWWTNIIHQCEQVLCQIASFSLCGHASGGYLMHCNTCAADNFRYVQLRCRNTTFTDPFIPSSISFHFMSCHFISFHSINFISWSMPFHFASFHSNQAIMRGRIPKRQSKYFRRNQGLFV